MPEGTPRNVASKRRYERMPLTKCSVEVFRRVFFGMREKALATKAVGVDLSEVGIRIAALTEKVSSGEKLRLVAKLDLFGDTIEGECSVVWCVPNARAVGEFVAGCEWTTLAPGHFGKIQQIRKVMRSKEYQQKLQTSQRMRKEEKGGPSDGIEFTTPRQP